MNRDAIKNAKRLFELDKKKEDSREPTEAERPSNLSQNDECIVSALNEEQFNLRQTFTIVTEREQCNAFRQRYAQWIEDYLRIPGRQVMISYNVMPNGNLPIEDDSGVANIELFKCDRTPICFADTLPRFLQDEYIEYLSANARRGTIWLKEGTKDIKPISRSFHPIWARCEGESTEHIAFSPDLLPSMDSYLEDFLGMLPTLAGKLQDIYQQVTERGINWQDFCSNLIDADNLMSLRPGEIARDRQGRTIFTISRSCELPFLGDNPPRMFFVAPGAEAKTVGSDDLARPLLIPLQSENNYH